MPFCPTMSASGTTTQYLATTGRCRASLRLYRDAVLRVEAWQARFSLRAHAFQMSIDVLLLGLGLRRDNQGLDDMFLWASARRSCIHLECGTFDKALEAISRHPLLRRKMIPSKRTPVPPRPPPHRDTLSPRILQRQEWRTNHGCPLAIVPRRSMFFGGDCCNQRAILRMSCNTSIVEDLERDTIH